MNKKKFLIIGIIAGIVNGLFGGGGGMVIVPRLAKSLNDQKKAQATAMAVTAPVSVISAILFICNGYFPLKSGIPTLIGVVTGGIIGARLLNKIDKNIVEKIFYILITVLGLKMIIW